MISGTPRAGIEFGDLGPVVALEDSLNAPAIFRQPSELRNSEKCRAICAEHIPILESRSVELDLLATEIRIKVERI